MNARKFDLEKRLQKYVKKNNTSQNSENNYDPSFLSNKYNRNYENSIDLRLEVSTNQSRFISPTLKQEKNKSIILEKDL